MLSLDDDRMTPSLELKRSLDDVMAPSLDACFMRYCPLPCDASRGWSRGPRISLSVVVRRRLFSVATMLSLELSRMLSDTNTLSLQIRNSVLKGMYAV